MERQERSGVSVLTTATAKDSADRQHQLADVSNPGFR